MVRALPASGSVIVTHTAALRDYIIRMVRDVRGSEVAKVTEVVVVRDRVAADRFLTKRMVPIRFDHAFEASRDIERLAFALADRCNSKLSGGHRSERG